MIDYCNKYKIKAVHIDFDFEKVFDPTEWDAMDKILEYCNFDNFLQKHY